MYGEGAEEEYGDELEDGMDRNDGTNALVNYWEV